MIALNRLLALISFPLLIAGFYSYLNYHKSGWPKSLDAQALANSVDYKLYNVDYRQFDDRGSLIQKLESPLISHIPDKNTHWVQKPHLILIKPNQDPWDIYAEEAQGLAAGKEIKLKRQVRIEQINHLKHLKTQINTEELTYYPSEKIAKTSRWVSIKQGSNRLKTQGLIADLNTETLQLLAHAQGYYVPNTP